MRRHRLLFTTSAACWLGVGASVTLAQTSAPPASPPPATTVRKALPAPQPARPVATRPAGTADELPARPATGLLDEAGLFSDAQAAAIRARSSQLFKETGISLWLVTANYVFRESPDEYRDRLLQHWAKDATPAMVMLFDRATTVIGYSGNMPPADQAIAQRLFLAANQAISQLPEAAKTNDFVYRAHETLVTNTLAWKKKAQMPTIQATRPVNVSTAPAAGTTASTTPPAARPLVKPEDGVRDDTAAFTSAEHTALASQISALAAETGAQLYVVSLTYVSQGTAQERAQELAGEWLGDRAGAVLLYDHSSSASKNAPLGIATAAPPLGWMSPVNLIACVSAARAAAAPKSTAKESLLAAAQSLITDFRTAGPVVRESPGPTRKQWRIFSGVAGALALGAGALYLFQRCQEKLERRNYEQFFFPDIDVSQRLGAPYAGGTTAELSFAEPSTQSPII